MICEQCGKQLYCGSFITNYGNEIEYQECEDCGVESADI